VVLLVFLVLLLLARVDSNVVTLDDTPVAEGAQTTWPRLLSQSVTCFGSSVGFGYTPLMMDSLSQWLQAAQSVCHHEQCSSAIGGPV